MKTWQFHSFSLMQSYNLSDHFHARSFFAEYNRLLHDSEGNIVQDLKGFTQGVLQKINLLEPKMLGLSQKYP